MLIITEKRKIGCDTGATKEMPLHIASSSDGDLTSEASDPIEIGVEDVVGRSILIIKGSIAPAMHVLLYSTFLWYTVKYGLVVDDQLSMSIIAIGRIGVWRVTHMETIDSDQSVLEQISKQMEPYQPENHSFIVVEIYKGVHTLLFN